ncbi:LMBR1 domain-containing protein 2 homolog A [Neltuma alba]|uniref:LMBR1 domain-containing protein 2 homolog A n=1 Tax=Neltuma alba TaxID=207710 RepID=UPI0010A542C9|nr:LMBR1 domain-containing protein 2 homolog A-like [Prosopis alba]
MWVFYLISLPLTLGLVLFTLRYFSGPHVPRFVLFTVGYAWFCSLSIIILVPADIWETISSRHKNGSISFLWSWSYWSTFLLTWAVVPLIQGYEDAGDFTVSERLKSSLHVNLVFYLLVGAVGLIGVIFLIIMHKTWSGDLLGLAMACSNTFGLVTGAFLLGYGLSEIPKSIWRNADWSTRQKVLSHKIAKMTVKLDDAHQELSNAIAIAQATSSQMSKRDPLRPYMDVIDNFLTQMFRQDPSFKPQGSRLAENDMDYDTDEKSMATLRRHLRLARERYYRYKSEYSAYVREALELEDTIKSYERHSLTGWRYISSMRPSRPGKLGNLFDSLEYFWRCILRKHVEKGLAASLGTLSVAILLAEATLLPGVDLSLFSFLIKSVGTREVFVQACSFVPLMYMCICTYYSLFRIGRLMFYSLTPRQTSSVSLLMICSMVARYAPPVSYNFLNLSSLGSDKTTVFEQQMGNINNAVPFFGDKFNKIYPLIMVIYTLLVASNFFNRVLDFLGSWKRYIFETEAEDMDGFNPTGLLILQKERFLLEHGSKVGEQIVPLTRTLNGIDIESGNSLMESNIAEMRVNSNLLEKMNGNPSRTRKDEIRKYSLSKEAISNKYAAVREKSGQASRFRPKDNNIASTKVPLLDRGNTDSGNTSGGSTSGLASTWQTMKSGFESFKANVTDTGR